MSFVKIWVHIVFSTKNREEYLIDKERHNIFKHIMNYCENKEIFLQAINGYTDHVHCLISLGKDQTISQVVKLIKGESSFWINRDNILPCKFSWQDDYYAVSVSESKLETVVNYIKNQEQHHCKKTFFDEVQEFTDKYGFVKIKNN